METIESLSSKCRVATPNDTVLHSECAFTFHTPYTRDDGIVVNLNTFMGTIQELAFSNVSSAADEKALFLRIVKDRVEKEVTSTTAMDEDGKPTTEQQQAPTKLAIGVEGGFATDEDKYETITKYSIVVLQKPNSVVLVEMPYDDTTKQTFSETIQKSVESIIHHVGMAIQQDLSVWQDDEEIPVSKYANSELEFVDNGVKISPDPKSWKCAKRGDTDNLWLNLSDGYIGGGRQHWDGSGGSNGALDHFKETGEKYPLVVKLGTITADSSGKVTADCYSYAKDEDGPVLIPNLKDLLAKRGIQVAGLQKTEKSTAELEVELNANYAFDAITESGSKLISVSGPSLQGLQNLGNSCYLNSVMQLLCSVPEFVNRYGTEPNGDIVAHKFLKGGSTTPKDATNSLIVQTTKLVNALTSGVFSIPKDQLESQSPTHPKYRLAPRMFKHVIGKDHVDFRTGQQQDASQFMQYYLEQIDRAESKIDSSLLKTSHLFSFQMEERLVCSADQKVKYKESAPETMWSLSIPMDKAEIVPPTEPEQKKQKQEGEDDDDKVIPTISFATCLESWSSDTTVDDYRWPHLHNAVHPAIQKTKLKNFPRYLWVQMQRYKLGPDWQPIKLEVNLDIPEEIDLTNIKATGPQDGEDLVPPEEESNAAGDSSSAKVEISEAALSQLMDMGFGMNGCKRALMKVGGSDTEAAMNWIFEHNMDPDFNDPIAEDGGGGGTAAAASSSGGVDDAVVMSLVESLGCFTIDQVRVALQETNGAADRAADWLFSHMDDLDSAIASAQDKSGPAGSSSDSKVPLEDGDGKYKMVGMISHIGKNTGSGHYVAHIKRDGKWTIFNDEKVALSENPPIPHAYLYLFQRSDTMGSKHSDY